jgi:hypothetical protein
MLGAEVPKAALKDQRREKVAQSAGTPVSIWEDNESGYFKYTQPHANICWDIHVPANEYQRPRNGK